MTAEQYNQLADRIRNTPGLLTTIRVSNVLLTAAGFLAYPILLLLLFPFGMVDAAPFLLYLAGPALAFVLLSLFRRIINRRRPYETMDIRPLISKNKKGRSFPSRHVFSFAMIAVLWFPFYPLVCPFLLVGTFLLAVIRVVSGVHTIEDVLAGALLGILAGSLINMIFYLLIVVPS